MRAIFSTPGRLNAIRVSLPNPAILLLLMAISLTFLAKGYQLFQATMV